ncbi:MAG: response regulator transcription factor [Pyrinomonadaceae bacterium]
MENAAANLDNSPAERHSSILVVEDSKDSREMLTELLRTSDPGYIVTAVETAAEALALDKPGRFDLYILDIWLPGMDGISLCRRLRERGRTEPILFFSAMVQPNDKDYVLKAGADEFLIKPRDLDLFLPTVRRLLQQSVDQKPEPSAR